MQSQFDARGYLKERYESPQKRAFSLNYFYSIFSKYHDQWDPSRATLLELGGGPSIQVVITAAPFFSRIVHSDFEDSCNKEVRLWVDRSPNAFNWTPVVEYAMKHCEGATESEVDSQAVAEREEEVRRKMSAVVHCDAMKENVGLDPSVIPDGGFDVVTAVGCFTSGARTQEEFFQELKNVHSVLKEGGYLFALLSGKCTTYKAAPEDSELIHTLYVTDKDVKEGIAKAGLHLEELEIQPALPGGVADAKELYCCIARKRLL